MPVYHLTFHAYGTWNEDHPKGYVQRGQGLKPPSPELNRARRALQKQPPARFDPPHHPVIQNAVRDTLQHRRLRPHGLAITPTHLHLIFSFPHPLCTCTTPRSPGSPGNVSGAPPTVSGACPQHCRPTCPARVHAESAARRLKKDVGFALADDASTRGRKWLSRGWDLTPVRTPPHLAHLLTHYLPQHESQAGTVTLF